MDIDDKDIQDQNIQLVGESSSKVSSSVLNVYALPKFEFDDNLNGHLRFDNLVDNEVFLGITNQENNHWIEEYSSGTNTIQFDSRPKNVWSEATSSESVEMLLKSVGQEDKVAEETVIEELDTCDKRVSLTTIMDPDFQGNFVGTKVSLDESQSQENQISGGELDSVIIGAQKTDKISDNLRQEASKITNESSNELLKDSSQNVDATGDECQENLQEVSEMSSEHADDVAKDFDSSEPDNIIMNKDNTYSVKNLSVVLNVESVDKQPVEDSIHVDEGPTVSLSIDSCDMQIDDSYKQSECSNSAVNLELNDNLHEKSLADSSNSGFLETQEIEETDTKSDINDHSHHVEKKTENIVENDEKSEMGEGNKTNNVGKTSLATEFPAENIPNSDETAVNSEINISNNDETVENSDSKAHITDSNDGNQIKQLGDETQSLDSIKENQIIQVGDESQSVEPDIITNDQDPAFNETQDAELNLDLKNMEIDVVVEASGSQMNVEIEPSLTSGQESESNMAVLTDAVAVMERSKISSSSETVATTEVVNEDHPRSPILGVSLLRNNNEEKVEVENTADCALDTVSDDAEKGVHEPAGSCDPSSVGNLNVGPSEQTTESVENLNVGPNEQITEDKCLNTSPNSCNLLKVGNDVVHTESITGEDVVEPLNLAVNTSPNSCNSLEKEGNNVVPAESITVEDVVEPLNLAVDTSPNSCILLEKEGNNVVPTESITVEDVVEPLNLAVNTNPNSCNSSAKEGNNVDEGGLVVPTESGTGEDVVEPLNLAVNTSDEQQASVHAVQNESGSVSLDKPQSLSFSDTKNIEISVFSEVVNDKDALQTVSSASVTKGFTFEVNANVSSSGTQLNPINLHEDNLVSPQPATNETGTKKTSERKPRRKSVGKETAKKGKEMTPANRSQKHLEYSPVLLTTPATVHVTPVKDLNNSISQFHQSFTDNQQLQLRAQILVYGSLISGTPPEEPHMIAAFGQSDGARRAWETVWHACLERVRGQTSQVNNPNTPKQSRSDLGKIGSAQSKVITTPIVSPMIPIPSPLWNIATPCDGPQSSTMHPTLSSLHPYQTQRAGHNPSWLSHGPFPGQWVASSPVTPFNARFSALPVTESVKLTTVKESGASGPPVVPVDPSAGQTVSSGPFSVSNVKKSTVLSGQPSSESKSRKRKKVVASQAEVAPAAHSPWAPHNQISFLPQNQTNPDVIKTPVSFNSERNLGQLSFVDRNTEKTATREEILSKIEESKVQAADAAVQAASAVSDCQNVWSQLATQKESGLISENEAKLASSAVSIAAASSVAKVAAFAAKIASNVAEQARLMADEVFKSNNYDQISHDKSNSIISAAKEAARRRIEAASTASKHAENLDAIVKAAELAAEAVSQAGKIVALTNPLTFTELVEAGPDSYWKTPQSTNQQGSSVKQNVETTPNDKGHETTSDVDHNVPQNTSGENIIKEGCLVEVYKDDNKYKGAWLAANVVNLKDGKAFVCYTEIQSDEGSEKLKEWVPLEAEGNGPPRIRLAHPMRSEGTRKRGRTALTEYSWCGGDRVDVWDHNCWREAVVVEMDNIHLTSLTVQFLKFPAEEKTTVWSWHVRPTLIWKDDKWIEWSRFKGFGSYQGDTPHEKRQKFVNRPSVEVKEKGDFSISVDLVDSGRPQESSTFNIGKSSKNENNKVNTHRTMKTGLQKERSRVVFGVPKPGKKQKFMDPNDSVKPVSQPIPGGSKKQFGEEKSKLVKSRKPPVPLVKQLTQKDKSKLSKPVLSDENSPGQHNRMDFGSSSSTDDVKEISTSKTVSQRLNKRKIAPDDIKSTEVEVKEKSTSELEPRRSNRKIQPTSRLLEGLQSSLTVSKIPSVSHARSHKVTPKGSTNSGS